MAPGKKRKPKYKAFIISIALSLCILGVGVYFMEGLTFQIISTRLFYPLLRLMFFIVIGLAAGQVIEALKWTEALSVVARPFFRFGNLGERCSAAFTAAFISGVTANAMLVGFYKDNKITKKQLFLSNFVNQLPAYFLHLPTTFFIVLPLTGKAGVIYFILTFTATLLRTFLFLLYGHLTLKEKENIDKPAANENQTKKKKGVFESIRTKLPTRVLNIAVFVLPVYIAVFVINGLGFFEKANLFVASHISLTILPIESLSVVVLSFAAEFTSGFAAAGALLDAGLITVKQTAIALLVGNILAFPIRALRHQLPRYIGVFAPKMGTQLLLAGQMFRVTSLMIVGVLYYYIF